MAYSAAERMRRYRERLRARAPVIPIDVLSVTCWCESTLVLVTPDDVKAGRTDTCGQPHCHQRSA